MAWRKYTFLDFIYKCTVIVLCLVYFGNYLFSSYNLIFCSLAQQGASKSRNNFSSIQLEGYDYNLHFILHHIFNINSCFLFSLLPFLTWPARLFGSQACAPTADYISKRSLPLLVIALNFTLHKSFPFDLLDQRNLQTKTMMLVLNPGHIQAQTT